MSDYYLLYLLPKATPLAYLAVSILAFFVAMYTTSSFRLIPNVLLVVLAYLSFSTSERFSAPWDSTWALMMVIWIFHSTSVLWCENWHLWEGKNNLYNRKNSSRPMPKHEVAWRLWNNPRLIGTPRQIPGIPLVKAPQNLAAFAIVRLGKAVVYILVYNQTLPLIFSEYGLVVQLHDFDFEHTVYFRRQLRSNANPVTGRETIIRSIWACLWACGAYITLDAAHAILSVFFVTALRTDDPQHWPPLFGSLSKAYTIRHFWGRFWHRTSVRPFMNFGELISRRLLCFAPDSEADKLCLVFTVFILSGIAHAAAAWRLGDKFWIRDIVWFCGNFAVGFLERFVLGRLHNIFAALGYEDIWRKLSRSALSKIFGFLWVFLFFFWSVPKWQYPKLYCAIEEAIQR